MPEGGETEPAAIVTEWPYMPVDACWCRPSLLRRLHTVTILPFIMKKITFYSKYYILTNYMERLHIATVGMTTDPILKGISRYPVDRLILLHSVNTKSYADEIVGIVGEFPDMKYHLMEIDPFALESVVSAILKVHKEHPKSHLSINITGGTNVMASAALLAGFIVGADVYYVPEKPLDGKTESIEDLVVELPVPKVTWDSLRKNQKAILLMLLEAGGSMKGPGVRLSKKLKTSPQNISHHLRALESKDLIQTVEGGRTKTVALTKTGSLFARIY
jgi:CRISPR locus-related DNA-binding protein